MVEKVNPNLDESLYMSAFNLFRFQDRKLFEKLQKRVEKLENLRTEIQRITAKENDQGGLTDGQQQTISRNEKRMAELETEIEQLEDTIREKYSRSNLSAPFLETNTSAGMLSEKGVRSHESARRKARAMKTIAVVKMTSTTGQRPLRKGNKRKVNYAQKLATFARLLAQLRGLMQGSRINRKILLL